MNRLMLSEIAFNIFHVVSLATYIQHKSQYVST